MIKIHFSVYSQSDTYIKSFYRNLPAIPRIGDMVVHHFDQMQSEKFKVTDVCFVVEDRDWYKNHKDFGDSISVALKEIVK